MFMNKPPKSDPLYVVTVSIAKNYAPVSEKAIFSHQEIRLVENNEALKNLQSIDWLRIDQVWSIHEEIQLDNLPQP